jgi:hypothetical protein
MKQRTDHERFPGPVATTSRCCGLLLAVALLFQVRSGAQVVISQVYGGGGNSGALYRNDFIELFNRGSATVDLSGWTAQYASAAGSTWQMTSLEGRIASQAYYLIQEAQGAGGSLELPVPDALGSIALSATSGKVALVANVAALSGTCPAGGDIVDFVGYGTATCFEGAGPAPGGGNTIALLRLGGGLTDSNDNRGDFLVGDPLPRNSQSPPLPVELSSFRAVKLPNGVRLEWRTASETHNLGFLVQRRAELEEVFADLQGSFISGHGTTLIPQDYTFLDCDPPPRIGYYRLKQLDLDGTIDYSQEIKVAWCSGMRETMGSPLNLDVFPNPFNPSTVISYDVPRPIGRRPGTDQETRLGERVLLRVFTILGKEIALLVDEWKSPGAHAIRFDGSGLPSGLYLCRLSVGGRVSTKGALLIR